MKSIQVFSTLLLVITILSWSCSKGTLTEVNSFSSEIFTKDGRKESNNNGNHTPQAGSITAGEWNDLDNWSFWRNLLTDSNFHEAPSAWQIYPIHRFSVRTVNAANQAVPNVLITLQQSGQIIFTTRTDNQGKGELWYNLFTSTTDSIDYTSLSIQANNGAATITQVLPYHKGINTLTITQDISQNIAEIAFVVDATGSMGDELEYLKTELLDVLLKVKDAHATTQLNTASVFYRDEQDEYLTRTHPFSNNIEHTIQFIKQQKADGGGDTPEAVHSALEKAVNELQWSNNSKTKLLFLLLDAPPHYDRANVRQSIKEQIMLAAEKGIKIIPIAASGIDKSTEFFLRFMAIATNGTYIFITDDSGIGNPHIKPTVGAYQVEKLNNLLLRLINKYIE